MIYFRVDNEIVIKEIEKLFHDIFERKKRIREFLDEICAGEKIIGNETFLVAVEFKELDAVDTQIWKYYRKNTGDYKYMYSPRKNTKAGKEMYAKLKEVSEPVDFSSFHKSINFEPFICEKTCRLFNRVGVQTFEKEGGGDLYILKIQEVVIPRLNLPAGIKELTYSEYMRINSIVENAN